MESVDIEALRCPDLNAVVILAITVPSASAPIRPIVAKP
jgi:hypothetical protein